MCGVGVVLVQVSGGAVCVKSVNKGGPAFNSQQINRGDVLYAIDGQKVGVCYFFFVFSNLSCTHVHVPASFSGIVCINIYTHTHIYMYK